MEKQDIHIGDTVQMIDDPEEYIVIGWFVNPDTEEDAALLEGGYCKIRPGSYFWEQIADNNESIRDTLKEVIDNEINASWERVSSLQSPDEWVILKRGNKTLSVTIKAIESKNLTDEQISNRRFFFSDLEKPHRNVNSGLEFL